MLSCIALKYIGSVPEKKLLDMSNISMFLGNDGIGPVSWFELKLNTLTAMPSRCAGKLPLSLLSEMSRDKACENVDQNQSGIVSFRVALEMSS